MTVIAVDYSDLIDLLGKNFSMEEIRARTSMIGAADEGIEGETMSFDISPNRPDMYSVEGLARSLRGVFGLETGLPGFKIHESEVRFVIDSSVNEVRPYAVGGFVRNVEMTDELVKSLMELQERLHNTIGRKRKKVAIGIHDADKVQPPFTYRADDPLKVKFVPLGKAEQMTMKEILEKHEKGQEYAHILIGKRVYPIIEDVNGVVLSFPPIINGIVTALTEDTRNLFIDVTGLDFDAVNSTLNIISTSLYERGGKIESVILERSDKTLRTPDLTPKESKVSISNASKLIGISLKPEESVNYLEMMRYGTKIEGDTIIVQIPAYRVDILHEDDLIEDVAIGYGYEKIPLSLPREATIGMPSEMNMFSQTLRELMIGYGYQEIMSLTMVDSSIPLGEGAIDLKIMNPVSVELNGLRSSLLASLLRIFTLNTHRDLPQRIFEVEDVIVGGKNEKHIAAASIHAKASFTEVKSLVQSLFRDLGYDFTIEAKNSENFIEGRCATVILNDKKVGVFGEIAPNILESYSLAHPVVAFELNAMMLKR